MKIAMVAWHGCIRVYKEAMALKALGHTVYLYASKVPFGYHEFDSFSLYGCDEQLVAALSHCDADVYHVHNEPDWLVLKTREARPNAPIVFDIHDLESLRWGEAPNQLEYDAFKAADAYIHVSESCKLAAEIHHDSVKPNRIVYAWVNERFVAPDNALPAVPCWNSMVYEGGLDAKENPVPIKDKPGQMKVNIRNMAGLFQKFSDQGISVSCISASPIDNDLYERAGCFVCQPVSYPSMLMALRPHGIGFVGAAMSAVLMEYAMPNKLFEYMSQGVVPVALYASEAARFMRANDCGIVLNGIENLQDQLADAPAKRENVLRLRHELTMEKQAGDIVSLYEEIIH